MSASDFRVPVKFNGNELLNPRLENRTSDPTLNATDVGRVWYRTDTQQLRICIAAATAVTFRRADQGIVSADITDGTITDTDIAAANKDGVAGTASLRTLGTGAQQSLAGNTRLDQITAPTAAVTLNGQKITNLADGTANTDAATLGQLSSVSAGKDYKESVRVATTGNETYTIAGGAVTTLAGLAGGAAPQVDGATVSVNDRILIKNAPASTGASSTPPTTQPGNGIYTVSSLGTGSITVARAGDADASAEISAGLTVWVELGTTVPQTEWTLTTTGAITLNTTSIAFAQTGTATALSATLPLTLTGMALALGYASPLGLNGSNQLTITSAVPINLGGTAGTTAAAARTNLGAMGRYAANIGDGAATSFTITGATHALGNSDLVVAVYDRSSNPQVEVGAYVSINTTSFDITISGFTATPTSGQYRVVVMG